MEEIIRIILIWLLVFVVNCTSSYFFPRERKDWRWWWCTGVLIVVFAMLLVAYKPIG
jgi:hypothetical protein